MNSKTYAVFQWRGDGRYHLRDAHGARVWKRESSAKKFADEMNAVGFAWAPQGFVVRPSDYFLSDGLEIAANGRVWEIGRTCTLCSPTGRIPKVSR